MSTRLSSRQQEMQTIREIQRHIASTLYSEVAWDSEKQDKYLEHTLKSIIQKRGFWSWQLLLVPMDNDFLRLAYRIILDREPDRAGLLHFDAGLSTGAISRTDVLKSMMRAPERDKYGSTLVEGGEHLLLIFNSASRLVRKVPLLNSVNRFLWRLATWPQRAQREELLLIKLQEEVYELKQWVIDKNEYSYNQKKRHGEHMGDMTNKVKGIDHQWIG